MNPPTEQLIRDYLNRLSIAARSKLGFLDRQMLLNQTRARIEAQCGDPASASVAEVRKALAALGDPVVLVEAAHAKTSVRKVAAVGALMSAPIPAGEPAKNGIAAPGGAMRRRGRLPVRLFIPRSADSAGLVPNVPRSVDLAKNGSAVVMRNDPPADQPASRGRRVARAARAAARQLGDFTLGLGSMAGRHKLETLAVLLLGVGGVIFPPIWLLGAILALFSRIWDIRDKWIALALPILGTVVGAALILVMGGQQGSLFSYADEAWMGAGRLVRVLVGLSAVYLLWRLSRGPRTPRQPPWNVPHSLDV